MVEHRAENYQVPSTIFRGIDFEDVANSPAHARLQFQSRWPFEKIEDRRRLGECWVVRDDTSCTDVENTWQTAGPLAELLELQIENGCNLPIDVGLECVDGFLVVGEEFEAAHVALASLGLQSRHSKRTGCTTSEPAHRRMRAAPSHVPETTTCA